MSAAPPGRMVPAVGVPASMPGMPNTMPPTPGVPVMPGRPPVAALPVTTPVNRQAKRLYVGNIPPNTNEEEIKEFFTNCLRAHSIVTDAIPHPVVSATVNLDKNFAFPEFVSPDLATRTLTLDGTLELRGHLLRIRRPNNYTAPTTPTAAVEMPPLPVIDSALLTNMPESPNRLVITGLGPMTDDQVRELLLAFGPLKMFVLAKDPATGVSKGAAMAEFTHEESTEKAIAGLDNTEMADGRLQVRRASEVEDLSSLFPTSSPEAMNTLVQSLLNTSIRVDSVLTGLARAGLGPTRVLVLLNLVTAEQMADDRIYEETLNDVGDECSQHGKVESVRITRPLSAQDVKEREESVEQQPTEANQARKVHPVVKVFVEYQTIKEAQAAQAALMGRKYAGRTVIVSFYDEKMYAEGQHEIA